MSNCNVPNWTPVQNSTTFSVTRLGNSNQYSGSCGSTVPSNPGSAYCQEVFFEAPVGAAGTPTASSPSQGNISFCFDSYAPGGVEGRPNTVGFRMVVTDTGGTWPTSILVPITVTYGGK